MPPTPSSEETGWLADTKATFNLLATACEVVAFPVMICTTRFGTWGVRHLASPLVLVGFVWPWIFAALYGPHPRLAGILLFWYASIGLLLVHRVQGVRLRRRGYHCHSRYWGDAWFQRGDSLEDQRRARGRMVVLSFLVGMACLVACPPLGAMIAFGAVAKVFSDGLAFAAVETRLRQMEDARIENEFYLEAHRRRHGWN